MFIWPWGIGDADEDLEEIKGPWHCETLQN